MTDDTPTTGPEIPPQKTGTAVPISQPVTTVTAGTLIMGTYEIERLINSGGMGEVYRGRNIHNDEPVAIKIVLPSLAHDPKIVALFQKESTVLSRLAHEAIVRYHVFTNDPTIGRPCMVMEFVSGTALSDRIEQGPMPLDEVKGMLRRVASGLDKAHRAGVVHRDLSPDNVILEEGAVDHAKLIDFGIAKSSNFGSGTLLQGQFAGKFNWVSPEQLGAYGGVVDGRSDIYSLGLIVAGASRGSVLQMGASIVDAVSKRASIPDLSGVYPELVPLLGWMLEPDPAQRVESMAKVIAALDDPTLIPLRGPAVATAPDPNRTVIEPLPIEPAAAALAQASQPPMTAPPPPVSGWDVVASREASLPPDGATVIAAQPLTGGPVPLSNPEPEDVSPFGAPEPEVKPAPTGPAQPDAKGKGGMMGVLAVLAVAAGGGGVYFSGVLDGPKPAAPAVEQTAETAPVKPADKAKTAEEVAAEKALEEAAKAEADAKAAAEAAVAEAAAKAEAEAAAKADADAKAAEAAAKAEAEAQAKAEAESKAAEEEAAKAKAEQEAAAKAQAEEEAAKRAEAETAAKAAATEARKQVEAVATARASAAATAAEAEAAATAAETAAVAEVEALAAKAKAASEKTRETANAASAGLQAATQAGNAAKAVASSAEGLEAALARAAEDAIAAQNHAVAADKAASNAAKSARAALEREAARLAEEKAKQDALEADPIARQQAFLDGFAPPACVLVRLVEAKPEGFALDAFALDPKPLDALSAAWKAETGAAPKITQHLVNEDQCAAIDFMNAHKSSPLSLDVIAKDGVVKSGDSVEGVIKGLSDANFTLFVISGAGAATNLKDFVTVGADGTAKFKFALKLLEGQPSTPHILLAVTADAPLVAMLTQLKPGTSIGGERGLLPFIDKQLADAGVTPQVGLGYFRLEN